MIELSKPVRLLLMNERNIGVLIGYLGLNIFLNDS